MPATAELLNNVCTYYTARLAQQILASQDLEEVELDVAQVALVMTHPLLRRSPSALTSIPMLPAGNKLCYPLVTGSASHARRCPDTPGPRAAARQMSEFLWVFTYC